MIAAGGDADNREPRGGRSNMPGDKSSVRNEVEKGLKGEESRIVEEGQSHQAVKSQMGLGLPGSAEMLWYAVGSS